MKAKFFSTSNITCMALMTALLCILAPCSITLPISPVSYSLATLAIYFIITILDMKSSVVCVIVYLLLGFIGLPVFAGFGAGLGKLVGPTGGYLVGYIFIALIGGFFTSKFNGKIYMYIIGMILSTAVLYIFGTAWYLILNGEATLAVALSFCVFPFLISDLCKIIIASCIGEIVRRRLLKSGIQLKPNAVRPQPAASSGQE